MSASIQILSDHVINKIAAGEVVERPASVMKELIENAFDAGAAQIDIEVSRGGRQLVSVADNGSGMGRDDALLAIERHATSKISDEADIETIATLGFRGEALAAIASVSRFTLTTRRPADLAGTELRISGGRMQEVNDAGCPPGTRIEVRNLFFNVPARRKFLRTESTELTHLRQLFIVCALAHPETGLTFTSDGRRLYNLPAGGGLEDRIRELYGESFFSALRKLSFSGGEVAVRGYTGLPQTGKKDRSDQHVFVNGRPAAAPVVHHALGEAYRPLLARGRYPAAFLFIETDSALVDVNVHPTKKEVRFRHPNAVRDTIAAAIAEALSLSDETERAPAFNFTPAAPAVFKQREMNIRDQGSGIRSQGAENREQKTKPNRETLLTPDSRPPSTSPWTWCRVLGQAGGLYVVLETEGGLVLMDPQAAHERVLFEKFMRDMAAGGIQQQGLLPPEAIDLQPAPAEAVRKNLSLLRAMGFGLSAFNGDTFLVDALPVHIQNGAPIIVLSEVAHALEEGGPSRASRGLLHECVAQAACRASVKARDTLGPEEIARLVDDLAQTEMPYTCPHGRPTLIFTSFSELNRRFGRR